MYICIFVFVMKVSSYSLSHVSRKKEYHHSTFYPTYSTNISVYYTYVAYLYSVGDTILHRFSPNLQNNISTGPLGKNMHVEGF